MENPFEDLTSNVLLSGAVICHEMFLTLMSVGFNEEQALTIIIGILRNGA